jgi:TetR/AcrR family transcriptional regulator
MSSTTAPAARMKSEDRRESILAAATSVFGETGYVGTTTDQIAKAAGVSQPYVVRMFGSKQALFLEVLHGALDALLTTFRDVIATEPSAGDEPELGTRLGVAYARLGSKNEGMLLSLMHAFVLGGDPVIGEAARRGFLEVYELLRDEAGLSAEDATRFLAYGMLMNTLIGIRMTDSMDSTPAARELLETSFSAKLPYLFQGKNRE